MGIQHKRRALFPAHHIPTSHTPRVLHMISDGSQTPPPPRPTRRPQRMKLQAARHLGNLMACLPRLPGVRHFQACLPRPDWGSFHGIPKSRSQPPAPSPCRVALQDETTGKAAEWQQRLTQLPLCVVHLRAAPPQPVPAAPTATLRAGRTSDDCRGEP